MITVYIWTQSNEGVGHASMKISRGGSTKYYSWWPSGSASLGNMLGLASSGSAGRKHKIRNPISYGDKHLAKTTNVGGRQVPAGHGDHHPGGDYGYNRSDKDMEGRSADFKFYFRPSSYISAINAEKYWTDLLSDNKKYYRFAVRNCSTTTAKALLKGAKALPNFAPPTHSVWTPGRVVDLCVELGRIINEGYPMFTPFAPPPVVMKWNNLFFDPRNGRRQAPGDGMGFINNFNKNEMHY